MAEFSRGIDIGICGRKTLDAAIALNGGKYDGHGLDFLFQHLMLHFSASVYFR
jgi:hypothetical protein